jgi:hypothetical protein
MQPHMVSIVPHLTTNCRVRNVRISVPLIAALLDNERYFSPYALPTPAGEELRPMFRPRINQTKAPPRAPRGPSLRSLVKLALKCDSAEELGKRLRRRYQRQKQRQGIATGRATAADEAKLDRLLGE